MSKEKIKAQIEQYFLDAQNAKFREEADLFVKKARVLGQKHVVRLTRAQRRLFCHACYHFLKPGENCDVRAKDEFLLHICKDCGHVNKMGYK